MSITVRRRTAAAVAALALGAGLAPFAGTASAAEPDPCATQQTQYDRAVAKKASLDAKLAAVKADIREARADLKEADTKKERRSAKADLATAKEKRAKVTKAKKYQLKRIEKAGARLEACRAANPTPPPAV